MATTLLSASILSADFSILGSQIHLVENAGCDWLHIDVMDGHFVPNITMGPFIVEHCKNISKLPLDVHLMIQNPDQHIAAFANAGAHSISVHIENNPNIYRTLLRIRELGCSPAIVLNPGTPVSSIKSVLGLVDMILVMSVNPGFSGQKYIPDSTSKIIEIKNLFRGEQSSPKIQVDGGINQQTLPDAKNAGANIFVAASAIFKHPAGIEQGIKDLRKASDVLN
jgi:ribulose-phosphate 3-epimerase